MPATSTDRPPAAMKLAPDAPVGLCPAASCAERIARLEADVAAADDAITRELAAAAFAPVGDTRTRLQKLEAERDAALLAADAARDALSEALATTCAGAAAQLLAALRDLRVRDEAEGRRARRLERQARRFFAASGVLTQSASRAISQTAAR